MDPITVGAFWDELVEIEKEAFGLKTLGLAAALGSAGVGGGAHLAKTVATKAPTAITQTAKKAVTPALSKVPSGLRVGGSGTNWKLIQGGQS